MARKKATTKPGDKRTIVTEERKARLAAQSPWKKGISGNPAGRTPTAPEVKEALAAKTLEAVAVKYDLMMNSTNEMVRLKAADGFIDPFVSKAATNHKIDVDVNLSPMGAFLARMARTYENVIEADVVEVLPAPTEEEDA